ncbi:MAG TPA: carbohydrate-binding family 6 protein [Candidatus Paceibacterota bacterium]|nr:carbohydrate-binding family 6 protein [Verrucomicrobiota bacterium]HOX02620.1 carbohydrate-binding family 6 protein [Verrucomicrobiota bacterium]HRZ43679.1 carbohydrate-binding family 6 protein [Candidatus Paceibacterota bacterium]HRZ92902.1 carbohydrate-binding family 6 protein [Candidatus Paceibacterota bacterium]
MKQPMISPAASLAAAVLLAWTSDGALPSRAAAASSTNAAIYLRPADDAALRFAAAEIQRAASSAPSQALPRIALEIAGDGATQSYSIERGSGEIRVRGADAAGAMYGGLDVAEAIRLGTLDGLAEGRRQPFIARRGLKFNIPLDLRTPSYSDAADAFQANIPEVWSLNFWRELLDEMARHRFNVLTLWNLHPFPSLVKVPEFPEVALSDVLRTRVPFDEHYAHSGADMFRPEHLRDVEVVRRITIEEKIAFWRAVLEHARDRGIEVYWFTWNLFVFGAEGKHGITGSQSNPATIAYFRASVRELILTYPLLAGIGITAGERMEKQAGELSREQWLWKTYGEGARDALRLQPGRSFRLIHRFHMTGLDEIVAEFRQYPGPFDFSYKYAVAHMYASTAPQFIRPMLEVLPPDRRTWLTVRNDDIYSFRWGDPDFARAFVRSMPGPDQCAGFYMGPDGYCWGREAMDLEPETPRQLVMQKQWFSFMLWGRLSYDPGLPDSIFVRTLARRFPEVPPERLLAAWSAASRIIPETTRFFWGNIDLRWLPEACLSSPRHQGFYTVRHFVQGECMPGEKNLNIRQWRQGLLGNVMPDGITPPQVAANLRRYADEALEGVAALRPRQGSSRELRLTLGDLEAFAQLGRYYAAKIDAACALALYDSTADAGHQRDAIRHLEAALDHWRAYAAVYARQYRQPILYNRVGWVDIPRLTDKAAADIDIARQWKPGSVPSPAASRPSRSIFGE